jgi:hypothetical protein
MSFLISIDGEFIFDFIDSWFEEEEMFYDFAFTFRGNSSGQGGDISLWGIFQFDVNLFGG